MTKTHSLPLTAHPHLGRRAILAGAMAVPLIGYTAPAWAMAHAGAVSLLDFIPASEHAAIAAGRSQYDCGPALGRAMQTSGNVHAPAGRYIVASPVRFRPEYQGRFAPGPTLSGAGVGRTVFVNALPRGAMLDFDSGATASDFRAIQGLTLSGFTILGARGTKASGIRMRSCFMASLEDLHIIGMGGDGISIPCIHGDTDGSNMVRIEQVRIENCAGWGINAAATPGHNEISYLSLHHVFIQNCGVDSSVSAPQSGGMRYKGQGLSMDQCAFTLNRNVGLYIPGEAGLCINSQLQSTTFENNIGRGLLCTGTSVFRAENLQFFNNDAYRSDIACEFRGDDFTVREVRIASVTIRATAGNAPYTGFRFSGRHLEYRSCEVSGVIWENFGYPGQTRSSGTVPVV